MTEPVVDAEVVQEDANLPAVPEDASATRMRQFDMAWGIDPDRDFEKLALEAKYFAKGFTLVDKNMLLGVPHIVIGITYRPGYVRADGTQGDYVSLEAVVANQRTLESSPIKHMLPHEMQVFPNQSVVYNDGSTGIRRELTGLLHSIGVINVGTPNANENPFDRPYTEWESGQDAALAGIDEDAQGVPFRFVASRGLRKSEYESPFGPATTFYIG